MSRPIGQFVWCELMTTDARSAAAFYGAVIGWSARDAGAPHEGYTILRTGDLDVAGMFEVATPPHPGWQPGWIGYVAVDDLDAYVVRVQQAGGSVHRPAGDIPGVGRFAVVADPQGATFTLFEPHSGEPPPPAGATPGRVGWHELHAADCETAFAFYAGLFGWTKRDALDMGPMGIYQLFATGGAAEAMAGGMMTKMEGMSAPKWLYYFNVDDAGAAAARATQAGGKVLNGPHQVPGGSWIVHCLDPKGAMFAVVGPPSQP